MSTYAGAKAAYQELRGAIGPWAKANGFRRSKATPAGWEKDVEPDELLRFYFESHRFVVADLGSSYWGYLQLEPRGAQGATITRQARFECCLVQAELDEVAAIQGAINRRRPPVPPDFQHDVHRDTAIGHGLRQSYNPAPQHREGELFEFEFHSADDTRDLAAFIARVLPAAIDRFMAGRVARPIATTPEHLVPKWLRDLTRKPS